MSASTVSIGALGRELENSRLIQDPDLMGSFRQDEAHLVPGGMPLAVLEAGSTADVQTAMRWASAAGVTVVPRGAGSGLAGGAAAIEGCLVVSTTRMDSILQLSPEDGLARVQAGVVNADLDAAAAQVGLMYAPDPSSRAISTIGGNIATNAGGLRCVKYGVTREAVLGLQVVLADGRLLRLGRQTTKGVTGLDLTALFVGSEGVLGIVTEATVRLLPRPPAPPTTILGTFPDLASAGAAATAVVADGVGPALLELMDRHTLAVIEQWRPMDLGGVGALLLAQADGRDATDAAARMEELFHRAGADTVVVSDEADEAEQLLEIRRLAYPAAERLGTCLVEDVAVPISRLAQMLQTVEDIADAHGATILTVAHAGDGNLHPTFVFERTPSGEPPAAVLDAADAVFRAALDLGGTLTGEHGVGLLKQRWLGTELDQEVIDVQHAIKAALDPAGILNPGKAI